MNATQTKLLGIARSHLGAPYVYGAKPEEIPQKMDCSSFTQYIYKQIGIDLERSTILQAAHTGAEIKLTTDNLQLTTALRTGDLLFFRGTRGHYNDELFPNREIYIGHVAMYTEDEKAIHASYPEGVIEQSLADIIKKRGPIVMAKRVI